MINRIAKTKGFFWYTVVLAGLAVAVVSGCEKKVPTGTVQGKVTLNDAPFSNASVMFLSLKTGKGGSADIQPDGTFKLSTPLPTGSYKVYLAPKVAEAADGKPVPATIDTSVPDKYWNESSTDISVDVAEGPNNVPVPLKK